ncbi:MAG: hypothetical protein KJZ93_32660, partial [Caldilineaceae bacterium]|nr:hypothetical protein [Caldilineaceae bacterium]
MAELLPGYTWSADAARYRNATTGRFTSRRDIVVQLDAQVAHTEASIAALTEAFHEGRLSASVWTEQMRTELRQLHSQNRALGAGGWDRMSQRDWGAVGGKLQADYQRLVAFAAAVQGGEVTLPQALNRAGMYVGNARTQFWAAERDGRPHHTGMVPIERRVLGVAEHCTAAKGLRGCVDYYEDGWQLAGVLPLPGDGSTPCG